MDYLEKIKSLGLVLPAPPKPAGSYCPVILSGSYAFLSGQISRKSDGTIITGKVGKDLDIAGGQEAARAAAVNVISVLKDLVQFSRLERFIRVVGYVQAAPDFYDISAVMNGASDLFLEVFGEKGVHVRSAVGMASLPLDCAVEIEVTVELNHLQKK